LQSSEDTVHLDFEIVQNRNSDNRRLSEGRLQQVHVVGAALLAEKNPPTMCFLGALKLSENA